MVETEKKSKQHLPTAYYGTLLLYQPVGRGAKERGGAKASGNPEEHVIKQTILLNTVCGLYIVVFCGAGRKN